MSKYKLISAFFILFFLLNTVKQAVYSQEAKQLPVSRGFKYRLENILRRSDGKALPVSTSRQKPEETTYPNLNGNYYYYGSPAQENLYKCSDWGNKIKEKVYKNWNYPHSTFARSTIEIKIDDSGKIISTRFLEKSGREDFDNSILQAVQNSQPFEPMPSFCSYRSVVLDFYK